MSQETASKKKSRLTPAKKKSLRRTFICLIVGVVIGAAAVLGIQHVGFKSTADSTEETHVTASMVFDRVVKQSSLAVASMQYSETEKSSDAIKFFNITLPGTTNSYWYRSVGTITMSVDLSKMQLESVDGNKITVKLEDPYISANTPDMDESGVFEENNNLLNPIHVADVDEFKAGVQQRIEEAALEGDLVDEAKSNTIEDLANIFSVALNEKCEVEINWVAAGAL